MHLQQTKRGSRATGGPQYYFHDAPDVVTTYLRKHGAVPVALMTPYGATRSDFAAVSRHHKLEGERVVAGRVGHDRIQQAHAAESIGEAVRRWYDLPAGDFERIDLEADIRDEKIYVVPLAYRLAGKKKSIPIQRPEYPLSYHHHFQSLLWRRQLEQVKSKNPGGYAWAFSEMRRIVASYTGRAEPNVLEADILRASGPLNICGVALGPYLGKGYDCKSAFQFVNYVPYEVPIEIKKRSSGFKYQQQKYGKEELSRAVIVCVHHDLINLPDRNVDVIELSALAKVEAVP
jgi:hypothetical protein